MKKFKIVLIIFLLPISFSLYYLTSEKYGLSSYFEKKRILNEIHADNKKILNEITTYKKKIELLKKNIPDNDLLSEKAFEMLGITDKDNFVINLENL